MTNFNSYFFSRPPLKIDGQAIKPLIIVVRVVVKNDCFMGILFMDKLFVEVNLNM